MNTNAIETPQLTDAELDVVSGGRSALGTFLLVAAVLSPVVAVGLGVATAAHLLTSQGGSSVTVV